MTEDDKRRIDEVIGRLWDERGGLDPRVYPTTFKHDGKLLILKSLGKVVGYVKHTSVPDAINVRWISMIEAEEFERQMLKLDPTYQSPKRRLVGFKKYQVAKDDDVRNGGNDFCHDLVKEIR